MLKLKTGSNIGSDSDTLIHDPVPSLSQGTGHKMLFITLVWFVVGNRFVTIWLNASRKSW